MAVFVIAAIIGIAVSVFRKGPKNVTPEPVAQQLPLNVDIALSKAHFTEVRGNATVWTIVADRAEYSKQGETVNLHGVKMDFARNRTTGTITVTADRGTYSTKSKNVALRGNVHMTTATGVVFDTVSLDYFSSPSRFKTVETVKFNQQRMTLMAQGMDLDVASQTAHFHNAVEARVAGLSHGKK